MDAEHGDIGADHGLSDEGREYRGVVADVAFSLRNIALPHNLGDTLNDVILAPGVSPYGDCWVNRRGHGPGSPGVCRIVAMSFERRNPTCRTQIGKHTSELQSPMYLV